MARLLDEIRILKGLSPASLTDVSSHALVVLLASLNRLAETAGDASYGSSEAYDGLLDQLIPAQNLSLAFEACMARSSLVYDDRRDEILDRCFDFLDSGVLDAPIDDATARLIVQVLSYCSLEEEDDAPYTEALRQRMTRIFPELEAALLSDSEDNCIFALGGRPWSARQADHSPSVPQTDLLVQQTACLVQLMDAVALVFEAAPLLHGDFRLRALPLLDILRRRIPTLLVSCQGFDGASLSSHARLLLAFSRLLHADLESGPQAYHNFLATLALQGLDTLVPIAPDALVPIAPDITQLDVILDTRLCYLAVLAQATLDYESTRQDGGIFLSLSEPPPDETPPASSAPPSSLRGQKESDNQSINPTQESPKHDAGDIH